MFVSGIGNFPIPDTNTFANLPSSFHLNRLVDVLALHDSTVQVQKCNSCDENNPATSYCFVCMSFMCESCFQAHQRLKATRDHRNVLIDKLQAMLLMTCSSHIRTLSRVSGFQTPSLNDCVVTKQTFCMFFFSNCGT